jgi:hypothetical protein
MRQQFGNFMIIHFPIKQSLAVRQEQRLRTASSLPHATLRCPRISLNGATRTAFLRLKRIPAPMVWCRNQDFPQICLPLLDQGLTVLVRYDQKMNRKTAV